VCIPIDHSLEMGENFNGTTFEKELVQTIKLKAEKH
jgi:hypothetical protein